MGLSPAGATLRNGASELSSQGIEKLHVYPDTTLLSFHWLRAVPQVCYIPCIIMLHLSGLPTCLLRALKLGPGNMQWTVYDSCSEIWWTKGMPHMVNH